MVWVDSQSNRTFEQDGLFSLSNSLFFLHQDTNGLIKSTEHPTACCSMMANNAGELLMMVGDMSVHDVVTPEQVCKFEPAQFVEI